jgi:hypothetical protein
MKKDQRHNDHVICCIKAAFGIDQTNVHIQWNEVDRAFYQIRFCVNEPTVQK